MAQIIVHLAALRLIKIPLDLQIFPFEVIVWQFVHACRRPSGVYSFTVIFLWQTPATLICQRHYTHASSAQQHHCHLFTIACSNPGIRALNKGPWRESGDVVKDTKGSDKERQHVSGLKVVRPDICSILLGPSSKAPGGTFVLVHPLSEHSHLEWIFILSGVKAAKCGNFLQKLLQKVFK